MLKTIILVLFIHGDVEPFPTASIEWMEFETYEQCEAEAVKYDGAANIDPFCLPKTDTAD